MEYEYGLFTHTGMVRKLNEDYYYIPKDSGIGLDVMIVADGMGGHNAGDLASRMAVKCIIDYLNDHSSSINSIEILESVMLNSIQYANDEVYNFSLTNKQLEGMGTTLTMAIFYGDTVSIGHVGDSRGYLIGKDQIKQLTRDHSLVQELLDRGSISEDEMINHPQKNVITRALGTDREVEIDFHNSVINEGDIVLLCTDGLIQYVNIEESFKSVANTLSLMEIAESLGNKALSAGGADNITLVLGRRIGKQEKR